MSTPVTSAPQSSTSSSLYVGDIHPDVTETHLFEHFHEIGPIISIRVCRDAITRRSLGYAYVNFQNPMDAERALDTLNYSVLKGKPLRIMWRNSDPTLRKSGVGNIFIKNLDKTIDNQALHDTFSAFGNILSCKVATDETGKSRGYGFVHFETQDAADKAISKVNGMRLGANTVYVGDFIRKADRMRAMNSKWTNLFFKNVDAAVTPEEMETEFRKMGDITSFVFYPEKVKGKGYGFVNFKNHEDAERAVDTLNGIKEIAGKPIEGGLYASKAQKKEDRVALLRRQYEERRKERMEKYQGVNLYVKHIHESIDEERLRDEFKVYGQIQNVKIMRNDKGESRGFGFVCFKKPEDATKALTEMNNKMIENKPIYVALAQRKEVRRAQLQAQFAQRAAQLRAAGMMQPGMQPVFPGSVFYPGMQRIVYPPQPGMAPVRPRWEQPRGAKGVPRQGFPGAMPASYAMAAGRSAAPPANRRPAKAGQPKVKKGPKQEVSAEPIDPALLAKASPEEQRNILGSRLYSLVDKIVDEQEKDKVPKVTGMLLELASTDVLHLLESHDDLKEAVKTAIGALAGNEAAAPTEGAAAPADAPAETPAATQE